MLLKCFFFPSDLLVFVADCVCLIVFSGLTYVTTDPAHQFGLGQRGDTEAAVPVSSAEQQTGVIRHHQHLSPDVHPWGEGAAQEPLCSKCHTHTRTRACKEHIKMYLAHH